MIAAYASRRHFADHLAPIWLALPREVRGTFYVPTDVAAWLARPSNPHPVDVTAGFPDRRAKAPVLVAGISDHDAVRPRPTVFVNHGYGQSYPGTAGSESYSGGPGRERALLHIDPGPLAARATRAAGYACVEVGCPRLDWLRPREQPVGEVVAIAIRSHTPPRGCPEQRPAWPHYEPTMPALASSFDLLGHGHPRGWERTERRWEALGVASTADSYDVLRRASVVVTDTSSIGWEAASLGIPVVWCNAPWFRRHVEHGGRFWQPLPGLVVDEPEELAPAISRALEGFVSAWWGPVRTVYAYLDDRAAQRAAAVIAVLASR